MNLQEREFLRKYVEKKAAKRIKQLEDEIKNINKKEEKIKIKNEIDKIKIDLDWQLNLIKEIEKNEIYTEQNNDENVNNKTSNNDNIIDNDNIIGKNDNITDKNDNIIDNHDNINNNFIITDNLIIGNSSEKIIMNTPDNDLSQFKSNHEKILKNFLRINKVSDMKDLKIIKINSHEILKNHWDYLFDYQRDGVKWLLNLFDNSEGGILADEMGLGKTIQIVVLLSSLFMQKSIQKVLILCPATVMFQWLSEIKYFYPLVRVVFIPNYKYSMIDKNSASEIKNGIDKKYLKNEILWEDFIGVAISSYESFKNHFMILKNQKWDYLICDEGHKLKNEDTIISKYLKEMGVKNKILLTGTPIQNNLKEFWNLFDFVCPGLLGTYFSFYNEFEKPIIDSGKRNASQQSIKFGNNRAKYLQSLISGNILRRTKNMIKKHLPNKLDKIIFCNLTKEQEIVYEKVLEKILQTELSGIDKNCFFQEIDKFRKICNHLFLFNRDLNFLNSNTIKGSGKMVVVDKMLKKWKKENLKVLIFSQTIEMLNIIEKYIKIKNYKYYRMDGKTVMKSRCALVDDFNKNDEIFIFLLTTRVGGTGLNLTGASRIIIYDPDWNPSTDNQARERAYRFGQTLNIETYRLITKGTIEEKIYTKQLFKTFLSNKVLKGNLSCLFTKTDLVDFFSYEKPSDESCCEDDFEIEIKTTNEIIEFKNFVDLKMKMMNGKDLIAFIRKREDSLNN
ncbi:DNA excision repair protein CSB [Dictyocoela muelleri]|nr:DNA excision repair protein CSB [Dictyocoela muelleri]